MDDFDLERDMEDAGSSLSDRESLDGGEPQPEPGPAEEKTDKPAPGASERPDPEGEAKLLRQRNRLLWVIIILAWLVAALLGGLYWAERTKNLAPEPPLPSPRSESAAFPEQPAAAEPPRGPVAAPAVETLSDDATDAMITIYIGMIQDVSSYLSVYNSAMWEPDEISLDEDQIASYERHWARFHADMESLRSSMEKAEPSAIFRIAWEDLYGYVCTVSQLAEKLSDWDVNGNGEITGKECTLVNNEALDLAVEARALIEKMSVDYDAAVLLWEAKLAAATPRPTVKPQVTPKPAYATPKRTTSTPKPTSKSDPFNARDYTDPDDFYFDYYDDFYDYEDAEDYWNDWND